ncbi:MAG: FKBP-type peptidyl-prolyl cis-trans isomerase [Gammaproteobacteria bacterium]|jgi:FKBP-type peptidyl-prolyl cis-trans isomerase FklB|nr:FKBP-type peptidyl-prolyl cis-trans isomerase [Gammaproteobacteria bacterium]
MKKQTLLGVIILFLLHLVIANAQEVAQDSVIHRFSYTVGYQVGQQLIADGHGLDAEQVTAAIGDVLQGRQPRLTMVQMQGAIDEYQQIRRNKYEEQATKNLLQGRVFIDKNRQQDGIVEVSPQLQYRVVKSGSGKKPRASDTVVLNYRAGKLDGTPFDDSYTRNDPVTIPISGLIKGWQEILPRMEEGAIWKIFVGPELAYGSDGAGEVIGPNETLIFDIELVRVVGDDTNTAPLILKNRLGN